MSSINDALPIITSVAFATCTTRSPVFVIEEKISNFAPTLDKLFRSAPGPATAESEFDLSLVMCKSPPAASLCTILPEWVATVNDTLESDVTTLAGPVVINPALMLPVLGT